MTDQQYSEPQDIHGVPFLSQHVGALPVQEVKALVDRLCQTVGSGVVAVTAIAAGQAMLMVAVTSDLAKRIDAVTLAQTGVETLGGHSGGEIPRGTREQAQGHGPNVDSAADALTTVGETLAAMLDATMRGEAEEVA